MVEGFDKFHDIDLYPKFLHQLAFETLLIGLIGVAFSAGKFPEAAQVILRAALGDEEQAATENKAGRNFDNSAC